MRGEIKLKDQSSQTETDTNTASAGYLAPNKSYFLQEQEGEKEQEESFLQKVDFCFGKSRKSEISIQRNREATNSEHCGPVLFLSTFLRGAAGMSTEKKEKQRKKKRGFLKKNSNLFISSLGPRTDTNKKINSAKARFVAFFFFKKFFFFFNS
eukprot:TRINITY_DN712_c3_g2_i1.p1 TRINITY_DN712_c3_g2~~TRINITY_DN712_c3_g2_i1.p1  ORF type:complete len:153 (-),score=21.54 TRINITY_DN712_c3_g2_i1:86-544(-)